ncbi:MAG: hypothetical protein RL386_2181, partial [Bacteroidota bacterium]
MLMPNDPGLVRDFNLHDGPIVEDNALASQAGIEFGVDCPVYEIFLFIGYFFQVIFPEVNIYMTGTAGTHPAAIVVEVNIVCLGNFQQGCPCFHLSDDDRLCDGFIFEDELNGGHECF